jgi:hypothetical protein
MLTGVLRSARVPFRMLAKLHAAGLFHLLPSSLLWIPAFAGMTTVTDIKLTGTVAPSSPRKRESRNTPRFGPLPSFAEVP